MSDEAKKRLSATALPSVATSVADTIEHDWDEDALYEVVELPSGKRVQTQPVSLLSMIAHDRLPNTLMAAARRSAGLSSATGTAGGGMSEEEAQDGMKLIDFMVCAMCVRPRFVEKSSSECNPGERSVFAVWDTDKTFLFNRALRGQQALKSPGGE